MCLFERAPFIEPVSHSGATWHISADRAQGRAITDVGLNVM